MDINKFTEKAREAVTQAQSIAVGMGHQDIDSEHLALALTEVGAVARQQGLIPVRQAADKSIGVCKLCSGNALLIGGIKTPIADIVHNCPGKQVGVLKYHTQGAA